MTTRHEDHIRDEEGDAAAREWAREANRRAEAGEVQDDSEYIRRKLEEERRKLAPR